MINNILLTVPSEHVPFVDGSNKFDWGNGAIVAVVSILIVFLILALVIFITHFLFKGIDKVASKVSAKAEEKVSEQPVSRQPVVITDDDMMAAVLVATIDYQNEIKKGVRVVSVKEIN